MARTLSSGTMVNGSAGNYTSSAFSASLWVNPTSVATSNGSLLMWKGGFASKGWYWHLGRLASGDLGFLTNQAGALQVTNTNGSLVTTGAWQHLVVTRSGATAKIYRNGTEATYAEAQSHVDPDTSSDNFQFGDYASTGSFYYAGDMAEAALYSVALTQADISALALGYSPLLVRPEALDNYWPMLGRTSPEIDLVGGSALTLTNASQANHPRMIYPKRRQARRFTTAVAGGGVVSLQHIYRHVAGIGA